MIEKILEYNKQFVEAKGYEPYRTGKYPRMKTAILTCMDTRLTELLPAALGIHNGDVKLIKNAGGVVTDPYGEAVRSLLVAVYELGVTDVMVIAHTDCGACHLSAEEMEKEMLAHGISQEAIDHVADAGVDLNTWLKGFGDTERAVRETVRMIAGHPLMPRDIHVYGFIMDTVTGALTPVR